MSPSAGLMLLQQIVPLIAAAIARGAVKPVGCEDLQELQAEGLALAAAILDSAEVRSKVVSPGNIAHFTLQALKSGRRSGYAGRRDVMGAAAALDGNVHLNSMDEPLGIDDDGEDEFTLHDAMASSAGRQMWIRSCLSPGSYLTASPMHDGLISPSVTISNPTKGEHHVPRESKYGWPSSAMTAADMALLYRARECSQPRMAITELIAQAIRHTYGQIPVLSLPANPATHQDNGNERKAA